MTILAIIKEISGLGRNNFRQNDSCLPETQLLSIDSDSKFNAFDVGPTGRLRETYLWQRCRRLYDEYCIQNVTGSPSGVVCTKPFGLQYSLFYSSVAIKRLNGRYYNNTERNLYIPHKEKVQVSLNMQSCPKVDRPACCCEWNIFLSV